MSSEPQWAVRSVTRDGRESVTYGPNEAWARRLAQVMRETIFGVQVEVLPPAPPPYSAVLAQRLRIANAERCPNTLHAHPQVNISGDNAWCRLPRGHDGACAFFDPEAVAALVAGGYA